MKKPPKRRSTIDVVHNPKGEIFLFCGLCGECYPVPFLLHKKKYADNPSHIHVNVMSLLEWFFDQHYNLCNPVEPSDSRCPELDLQEMKEIRDKEMVMLGFNDHMRDVSDKLFQKLILLFLQVHLESSSILDYFDWHNFRPTSYGRQSKLFSMKRKN